MSTADTVQKLITVTGKLSQLVQQENEILAANGSTSGLKEIVEEKQTLSAVYEQHIKSVNDADELDTIEPGLRLRLKEAVAAFNALLEENRVRLEAKIKASQHLFEVISQAAKSHQTQAGVYGQSGSIDGDTRQAYRPPVSVGLNQEL